MTSRVSRPRTGEDHDLVIERLAYGGRGVARLTAADDRPGMTVFVARTAPGDRVKARLDRVRRRHAEASVVDLIAPGPGRVAPSCLHYEQGCGGCSWQHLGYATQLAAKQDLVRDSLSRIGGFDDLTIAPIVRADEPWFYRNKMEFSFNARDGLGLHVAGDWRRVVPVTECRLESELAMQIVESVRSFAAEHRIPAWDPVAQRGFLRELVIRHGAGTGQTMVGLITERGELPHQEALATSLEALDESIVSIVRGVRGPHAEGSPIESTVVLRGREAILEQVAGLRFSIGLQTFFQTSTTQAERMLSIVRRQVRAGRGGGAHEAPLPRILDVFCGVGFFALGLADLADEVIGVEIVEPSIIAARENARLNGVDSAFFYAGDARRTLPDVIDRHGAPDVVLLDPPRSGAGGKVMRRIARSGPARIVYVSCNPTTLARDLTELEPFGYRVTEVEPIDLFPQTYHVETIVSVDRS